MSNFNYGHSMKDKCFTGTIGKIDFYSTLDKLTATHPSGYVDSTDLLQATPYSILDFVHRNVSNVYKGERDVTSDS